MESTQPPFRISESSNWAVRFPISSGVSPGVAAVSEDTSAPVVDSATRDSAKPGDLRIEVSALSLIVLVRTRLDLSSHQAYFPDSSPLYTSVYIYTSGIYLFKTDLADSTN